MENRRYFPCERNSYYFGKLLNAWDFEAEQRYFNDKRRLGNRLNGANGILAGLGVIKADDSSIILQAGCALDASGREIVVPETNVIKLSTIEGAAELTEDCAYLGIRYVEQPADEVFSAMSGEKGETQYNRIREGYHLTLVDQGGVNPISGELGDYLCRTVLYADKEVQLVMITPKYLPQGCNLLVRVVLERLHAGSGEYSYSFRLETPAFRDDDNRQELSVISSNHKLTLGETYTQEFVLHPEAYLWGVAGSTLSVRDLTLRANGENLNPGQLPDTSVQPVEGELTEFYLRSFYGRPMDQVLNESYDEKLWIAKITFIRNNTTVLIDEVLPPPFGQYSYNSQQLMALRKLERFYPKEAALTAVQDAAPTNAPAVVRADQPDFARYTATGVIMLPIGFGSDWRTPAFSQEIMHGLGKGPVHVEIGVEYIFDDEETKTSEYVTGDISVFDGEKSKADRQNTYAMSTAVKVFPERGTFVAGVKLTAATDLINLRLRWFAFRSIEIDKQITAQRDDRRMIMVNPDTIVLTPKSTAHISPVFINMPGEPCSYSLVDPDGGTIDQNGLYTAPSKEGVYEIRVETINDPSIYTHAFAVVSQKKRDEK